MIDECNRQILAYAIGGAGIMVEWRAYCLHCGQSFRRWSAAGAVLWAAQYCLLNAWTAGLTMGCTALRSLLSGQLTGHGVHWAAAGFMALFAVLAALSWQGAVSLLPAFAVINTTLALFYFGNRAMRIALLASSLAWIGNDFYWQAWPAILAESVAMAINLTTIWRLFKA
ncbi:MAG: YgjV family protein [Methylococcales bacterium]|nr:YgjV family protein [Methylococcales bacterium]